MIRVVISITALVAAVVAAAPQASHAIQRETPALGGLLWRDRPPPLPSSRCGDETFTRLPGGFTSIRRPELEDVTVNVRNLPSSLGTEGFVEAVRAAARTWNDETNECGRTDASDANFEIVDVVDGVPLPVDDAVHAVMFADGQCRPASAVACTYPHTDPSTGRAVGWDILLERSFPWGLGVGPWLDVQNVVTHELGHVVGLGDLGQGLTDVTHAGLTMYAYTWPGDVQKRVLGLGDALGVEEVSRES